MLTGINTVNSNQENCECEYSKELIEAARDLLEANEVWVNSVLETCIDSELEEDFFE